MSTFIIDGDFDSFTDAVKAVQDHRHVLIYSPDNASYSVKRLVELILGGDIIEVEYMDSNYEDEREDSSDWYQMWARPSKESWQEHLDDIQDET
jgi:hypothetical protein